MELAELIQHGELLTPDDVAARLNVQRAMVYALLRRRTLPSVRVGRLLRVPAEAVETFITAGGGGWAKRGGGRGAADGAHAVHPG